MASVPPQTILTPSIANLVHNPKYKSHFPGPIFEVKGIKGVEQGGGLVYKLSLSDGRHWTWGILSPDLHSMIDDEKVKVHTIIKLSAYYLDTYKQRRFIAIEDLEVLSAQSTHPGGIATKKHLGSNEPGTPIPTPATNKQELWSITERTMLGDIGDLADKHTGSFLAVVLGKRRDLNGRKQDYYLWDTSSPVINGRLRKTILSVWDSLRKDFRPDPGTIVALKGMVKYGKFEEHPTAPMMIGQVNMGHLNIFKRNVRSRRSAWFFIDPRHIEGYNELKEAWEEQQYDLAYIGGDVIFQEMS